MGGTEATACRSLIFDSSRRGLFCLNMYLAQPSNQVVPIKQLLSYKNSMKRKRNIQRYRTEYLNSCQTSPLGPRLQASQYYNYIYVSIAMEQLAWIHAAG